MTPTRKAVADEFLAAAQSAGLKNTLVQVGGCGDTFIVSVSTPNPAASGNDRLLSSCYPYQFDDARHLRRIAAATARLLADAIPTIH